MQTKTSRKSGFTLVEIMIVVAIIGLLAAIAIPNFVKARTQAQKNTCIANLKQIDGAKEQWALETKQGPTATPNADDIWGSATAYIKVKPVCPADNAEADYVLNDVATAPQCPVETDNTDHVLPAP